MEKQSDRDKDTKLNLHLKKRDWIFLAVVIVAAAAGILWFSFGYSTPGNMVEVTVDGELVGTYPLAEAREIFLPAKGNETNRLVIGNGQASMEWADCPDQICVEHAAISHIGEEIVCLPNRVVVRLTGAQDSQELDAIAR